MSRRTSLGQLGVQPHPHPHPQQKESRKMVWTTLKNKTTKTASVTSRAALAKLGVHLIPIPTLMAGPTSSSPRFAVQRPGPAPVPFQHRAFFLAPHFSPFSFFVGFFISLRQVLPVPILMLAIFKVFPGLVKVW